MTYLLDVSVLLAWLWENHEFHLRVQKWQKAKRVAICPIVEIGFIRICSQPAFGASTDEAMELLRDWHRQAEPIYFPCDLKMIQSAVPPFSSQTTDYYLASLAQKHGVKWATLDSKCRHEAAFLIPTI
jgi:predicted nucleic acid-binding protein